MNRISQRGSAPIIVVLILIIIGLLVFDGLVLATVQSASFGSIDSIGGEGRSSIPGNNVIRGDYVSLSVPLVGQADRMKCGRAASAMVLNYYGANYTVADTGTKRVLLPGNAMGLLEKRTGKTWERSTVSSGGHGWNKVFESLKKGNPVIFFQQKYFSDNCNISNAGYGHIIVIAGYDPANDQLMINSSLVDRAVHCTINRSEYSNPDNLQHKNGSGTIIYSLE